MSPPSNVRHNLQKFLLPLVAGLTLTVYLSRFLCVAESAAQGETLWIVGAWLFALFCWSIAAWKFPSPPLRPDWFDLSVLLLAGGHILSALFVIGTTGDKRSAINLAWEWAAILIGWFLIRVQCRREDFRREVLVGMLAIGSTVAVLGLYQHYVDFVRTSSKYGPLFDQLRSLDPLSPEAVRIKQTLAADQIPVEGPALILFEKRLRDSREPLGLFALANNLGGFLAVCFILVLNLAVVDWRTSQSGNLFRRGCWVLLLILIGWCLLLTKSRTALIGTVIGVLYSGIAAREYRLTRGRLAGIGIAIAIVLAAVWGLSRFGGLDKQVITEAPKSLQYRLQYWAATLKMIKDHPWLGVGPGQYRSEYLFYKLPEASEEISDPHNLFLDVAANAGLLSIAGLLMFCAGLAVRSRLTIGEKQPTQTGDEVSSRLMIRTTWIFSVVAALCLFITGYDDRLLYLLPVAFVVSIWFRRCFTSYSGSQQSIRIASIAAAFCLVAHLMGAGGIGMPAIAMLLLCLVSISEGIGSRSQNPPAEPSNRWILSVSAFSVVASIVLFTTAIRPVRVSQVNIAEGDRRIQRGDSRGADADYQLAAEADTFDSEPWRRRADLAYQRVLADRFRSNGLFETAVGFLREAKKRHPANSQDDRKLGQWWLERWRWTGNSLDATESVQSYCKAWERYPTNAALMAEYAIALDTAGDKNSAEMARKSLQQDQLNHLKSHVDRYLPDSIREQLEKIDGTVKVPNPDQ